MLSMQIMIDIITVIIAILSSFLFILIILSFIFGKSNTNFMSILHIHLSVISLLHVINYMYFFDTEIYYHKDSPGFLCDFQGSIVASLCIAQVTILALIGIMMKTIFNNPEEIETYSKTNKIIIIIFGWVLPIGLFTFSLLQGGNEVDYSGYCRPAKNKVMIIVILLFSIFAYVLFFYSVISLGNTIKHFFKDGGYEKEGIRFLKRLRRYNLLLVAAVIKWLSDLGLFLLANTEQIVVRNYLKLL